MEIIGHFGKARFVIFAIFLSLIAIFIIGSYGILAFQNVPEGFESSFPTVRGSILDRDGKDLAVESSFYHFVVSPSVIEDVQAFANDVASALEMSAQEIAEKIKSSKNRQFLYLKKKLSQNEFENLKSICKKNQWTFVRFDRIPGRIYPENALASQLIGFMGDDGMGLAGIEYSMQSILAPSINENGQKVHGKNVYLTIDASLQYSLEKIARESILETNAESFMLLAVEAKTGEILSYISLPNANLNEYTSATSEQKRDRPAMDAFEPGSVFKIFTVATLLDSGVINQNDNFYCDGIYEKTYPGEKIKITCLDHHGYLTPRGALEMSCNDALAQMAERAQTEKFLADFRAFGFGQRTGIQLPGESDGFLKNTNDKFWSARSKPTIAIGQELMVTALQMVQATTAIANHGIPVQLSVISRIATREDKTEYVHIPQFKNRVLKESTANYLLSCMETVARRGTGHRASLSDVSIGVKTGTAQMADIKKGGYSDTDFLSDCIAIFPIEDPEIILYIVIQKAKGETYAGRIVAPVIAKAADVIIDHLGMSRGGAASLAHSGRIKIQNIKEIKLGALMPDLTGVPKKMLLPILEREDLKILITGDGYVKSQSPEPGTPITEKTEIELRLE